jgi:hypothetical protein
VLGFAEFLLSRSKAGRSNGAVQGGKAARRYVGGVKQGALAPGIDDELFGQPVR